MLRARAVGPLVIPFGYLVGHVVACITTHGLGHQHLDTLSAEHTVLPALSQVAVPLLVLSLVAAGLVGARGDRWSLSGRSLALLLTASFVVVELSEHAGLGLSPVTALTDRVLWVGLVVQLLLAAGLGRLLRRAHRVGARFSPAVDPPPALAGRRLWQPHDERPCALVVPGTASGRGPPASLSTAR